MSQTLINTADEYTSEAFQVLRGSQNAPTLICTGLGVDETADIEVKQGALWTKVYMSGVQVQFQYQSQNIIPLDVTSVFRVYKPATAGVVIITLHGDTENSI